MQSLALTVRGSPHPRVGIIRAVTLQHSTAALGRSPNAQILSCKKRRIRKKKSALANHPGRREASHAMHLTQWLSSYRVDKTQPKSWLGTQDY